jgi:chaperonin GroES
MNGLGLRPVRDRLLVEKDPASERIGSLIVPESARKAQSVGTILSVGPGYFAGYGDDSQPLFRPTEFREGDRVVFGEYAGVELKIDGRTLWVLVPDEICCKVGVADAAS